MAFAIIFCLAADAWALDSAVATGFATAVRANPTEPSVLESAPATMALGDRYTVGITGGIASSDELGFRIEGMDSKTGSFALGISYVHDATEPETTNADLPGWRTPGEDPSIDPTRHTNFAVGGALGWADDRIAAGSHGATLLDESDLRVGRHQLERRARGREQARRAGHAVAHRNEPGSRRCDALHARARGTSRTDGDCVARGRSASDFTSDPDHPVYGVATGGEIYPRARAHPGRLRARRRARTRTRLASASAPAWEKGRRRAVRIPHGGRRRSVPGVGTGTWHTLELIVSL